jgi:hypothetical protein
MQIWLLKQRFVTYCQALHYVLNSEDACADGCEGVILDRSIFSDVVFAEKNFVDENFTRAGYDFYLELRKRLLASLPQPDAVVYLDASPKTCAERVKMRSRDCECGIPMAYLEGLDACYSNFMDDMRRKGTPALTLPWEQFGTIGGVAEQLRRTLASARQVVVGADGAAAPTTTADLAALKVLIQDTTAIRKQMNCMPMIAEALGPDAKEAPVADPDVLTQSECVVTPLQNRANRKKPVALNARASSSSSLLAVGEAPDTPGSEASTSSSSGTPTSFAGDSPKEPAASPAGSGDEESAGSGLEDAQQRLAF